MAKTLIKKTIIFILLIVGVTFTTTLALDKGKISSRESTIIDPSIKDTNYIKKVKYESKYVYFNDLFESNNLPEDNKIYVMENATDLYNWSILASGNDRQKYLNKHYILGSDINYSAEIADPSTMHFRSIGFLGNEEVLPINPTEQQIINHSANNPNAFQGIFDGRGFTIKNLLLERVSYENINSVYKNSIEFLAPFARIGIKGTLKNVGFISTVITGTSDFGTIKYVSNVIGETHGKVERVYYRDERSVVQQGISFLGRVHISGFVSRMYAQVLYVYVAATRLVHLQAQDTLSVSAIVKEIVNGNNYFLQYGYYDSQILMDINTSTYGIGISTADFRNRSYFPQNIWVLYNEYSIFDVWMNNTYPETMGFQVSGKQLYIRNEAELIYFNKIINGDLYGFNKADVIFYTMRDMDLLAVKRKTFKQFKLNFAATLQGSYVSYYSDDHPSNTAYFKRDTDFSSQYSTILNLDVDITATEVDNHVTYGLFSQLSGKIYSINFTGFEMKVADISQYANTKDYVAIGYLVGEMLNGSMLQYVQLFGNVGLKSNQNLTSLYMGAAVGLFRGGQINYLSHNGETIDFGVQIYDNAIKKDIHLGGILGSVNIDSNIVSTNEIINNLTNASNIEGISFSDNQLNSRIHLGGVIGYIKMKYLSRFTISSLNNYGDIEVYDLTGNIHEILFGGVVGLMEFPVGIIFTTYYVSSFINTGKINFSAKLNQKVKLAGVVNFFNYDSTINQNLTVTVMYNYAKIDVNYDGGTAPDFGDSNIGGIDIDVAGIYIVNGYVPYRNDGSAFFGIINADMTIVRNISGGIIFNDSYSNENVTKTDVFYKYDSFSNNISTKSEWANSISLRGKINVYSTNKVYHNIIKVAGGIIGKNVSFSVNGGVDIDFNMTHEAPSASILMPLSDLNMFNERYIMVATVENAKGFNGGTVSIINVNIADFGQRYNLYVTSGVFMTSHEMSLATITVSFAIREGDINVKSSVIGNSYVAAGVIFGKRLYSFTITNLGNIYNELNKSMYANLSDYIDRKVITSGGAALIYNNDHANAMPTAFLGQSVNYGNITSVSNIGNVAALSAGFIGMLDRGHNNVISQLQNFSISSTTLNYGNIISWSPLLADLVNVTGSGGIIADGTLSTISSYINYGNIYTNGWGGGAVAFLRKQTGTVSNTVNYGKIKQITSKPTDINEIPTISTSKDKLGAIFGYMYLSYQYPFNRIANFDKESNWVSRIDNSAIITQTHINSYKATWATLSTTDTSPYPLTGNIKVYTLDESVTGIYHDTFFFKTTQNSYMAFLPTVSANKVLMQKIGLNFNESNLKLGLYAAGKSGDRYYPETNDYQNYNSYFQVKQIGYGSNAWMKEVTEYGSETLYYKINKGIRQTEISKNMKANYAKAEIYFEGDVNWWETYNTETLSKPEVSADGYTLTFYEDTNLSVNYDKESTYKDTYTYIKTDSKYASYGAVFVGGIWVGTHSLTAGSYQLKANGTHVKIPVRIYDTPEHRRNLFNKIEAQFEDTKTKDHYYDASGTQQKVITPARLSNSVGPYDEFGQMRGINNEIIDSLDYNAGMIRGFSEAYEHNDDPSLLDPTTYKDIKIIIRRLNDFDITGLIPNAANLNQFVSTANYKDLALKNVLAKNSYTSISFSYKNAKIYNSYTVTTVDEFDRSDIMADMDAFIEITTTRTDGKTNFGNGGPSISTANSPKSIVYDNMGNVTYVNGNANTWDGAYILINFYVSNLDGGEYTSTIKFGKNNNIILKFKYTVQSSDVLDLYNVNAHNNQYPLIKQSPTDHIYLAKIPYGMSYDPNDSNNTSIVNFENYKSMIGVKQRDYVHFNNIYLNYGDSAAFVSKANVTMSLIDGKRHRYNIEIELSSESGVKKTPIYITIEEVFDTNIDVKNAYKDEVKITSSFYDQRFSGDESPAYRYEYDFSNLYLKNYVVSAEYTGMGNPIPNVHYHLAKTTTGFRMAFNNESFAGMYKIKLNFDKTYTFNGDDNPLKDVVVDWTIEFNTPEFYKIGSNESLIKDIAFISESSFTGYETVIDYQTVMTQTRYLQFLDGTLIRPISLIPTLGIDYKTHADESLFYIVGQVAKTDLSHYAPVVVISKGAIIRRVLDDGTLDTDLFANYNPGLIEFAYHKYRVFAESYIPGHAEFGGMYKDYVIAVHDIEDTVNINLTIEFDGSINPLNKIFFNIRVMQNGSDFMFGMSFNAYFDSDVSGYKKIANEITLPSGTSGMYHVTPSLPDLYEVEYYVSGITHGKTSFGLPAYILPRKYDVRFIIREKAIINLPGWGQTN